uniref:Uncharacterized protein n=1 Tax=Rhipicephalus zambeziensis TaxID=60191 RepID=A0A224Y8M6_9ACAR
MRRLLRRRRVRLRLQRRQRRRRLAFHLRAVEDRGAAGHVVVLFGVVGTPGDRRGARGGVRGGRLAPRALRRQRRGVRVALLAAVLFEERRVVLADAFVCAGARVGRAPAPGTLGFLGLGAAAEAVRAAGVGVVHLRSDSL